MSGARSPKRQPELELALQTSLEHARKTEAYRDCGRTFEDLAITEKVTVRKRPELYIVPGVKHGPVASTSGTTGTPLHIHRSRKEHVENATAVADALVEQFGRDHRALSLQSHNTGAIGALIETVCEVVDYPLLRAYPYEARTGRWRLLSKTIAQYKPTLFFAAPGTLLDLEQGLRKEERLEVVNQTQGIVAAGEVLTPGLRARLEECLNCAIRSTYGSTEVGTVAVSCCEGNFHPIPGRYHLELRGSEGTLPLSAGGGGELIVTPLHAEAFALLRYATGDQVDVKVCDCGKDSLAFVPLGRSEDEVTTPVGVKGPMEIEKVIYGDYCVADYRLVVDESGTLCKVQLLPSWGTTIPSESVTEISEFFQVPTVVITRIPVQARAAARSKSWKRARVQELSGGPS